MNMEIKLGDIFWLEIEKGIAHPHVVISIADSTVVVCAITTNQKKANMPGNVVLEAGEANLEKLSVVEVYKEYVVKKTDLKEYIGNLSAERIEEIVKGINFIKNSFLPSDRIKSVPTSPLL